MKRLLLVTLFFILASVVSFADIEMTDEEQEWLEEHPIIRFAGDPSWPPIDFLKNQQQGLGVDYLKHIEKMLGIHIEYVYLDSWDDIVRSIENKEVDMILGSYHASRADSMVFSEVIIEIPYIIISKNDFNEPIELAELNQKKLATVDGWVLNQVLQENHTGVKVSPYPTVADALRAVSFGEEELMVHELASASYEIESHKITNLKFLQEYPRTVDTRFIIRKDYDTLRVLIDKVLLDMSSSEKREIYNQWISLSVKPFYREPIYYVIALVIVLIGVLSFVWMKILRRQIRIKTQELKTELDHKTEIQKQLEASIRQQKDMQQEMIQQERLASLGSMVASISHEINNPLGVCLTTSSAFKHKVEKLKYAYEHDSLKKNQFVEFIETSGETAKLIETNLQRAIQTISGFKNMAINQMHGGKELINVCHFMTTMKENLKYELKKKNAQLDVVCAENVLILGDVGALTQIMTNLILNSLVHGFDGSKEPYQIQIKSGIIDRMLVIEYKDNGVGIQEEHLDKIFKLFFTTKREQGGSGIGLHIVQNLLKEKFDGTITCMNGETSGVIFTMHMPMKNH